ICVAWSSIMNSLRLRRPYAHTACDMYIHSRAVLAIRIHRWTTFVYCSPIMIPQLGEVNSLRGEMRHAATREPEPGALKAPGLPDRKSTRLNSSHLGIS